MCVYCISIETEEMSIKKHYLNQFILRIEKKIAIRNQLLWILDTEAVSWWRGSFTKRHSRAES